MTARNAEKITGLFVRPMAARNTYGLYLTEHNGLLKTSSSHNPSASIESLVRWNYDRTKTQVFVEQGWRCWGCGRVLALSCDHIRPRAHGRIDERWNLRGMCAGCHELHTRNHTLAIHPKIAALMSKVGYRWVGEWGLGVEKWGWERIEE